MIDLAHAAAYMSVALACGAVIGSERQVRQRMAGLRTNALVALAAAGYVVFSQLVPNEVSPTRVAAQVVSGIGFLGAGIIFREGFNVHGLNTAATLWCSAAVGLIAGIGRWEFALVLTGLIVFVNLGLRPLVKFIKRHTQAGVPIERHRRVVVTTATEREAEMRGVVLRTLALGGARVSELSVVPVAEGVELEALISGEALSDAALDAAVMSLAAEPGVSRMRWESGED